MEEDHYRGTYHAINDRRCAYEKTLLTRRCDCSQAERFNLADREGVRCRSDEARQRCLQFLDRLRHNCRFVLHLTAIEGQLPYAKEMKIQHGGLLGLQAVTQADHATDAIIDIDGLIDTALATYGTVASLPFDRIAPCVAAFSIRPKRAHGPDDAP